MECPRREKTSSLIDGRRANQRQGKGCLNFVIFDVDGTLVDSVDLHALAWQETFRKFGKEISFQDIRRQIGKGGDQLIPVFFSKEELDRCVVGHLRRVATTNQPPKYVIPRQNKK
jgi:phosphoglycolate phosphatase-like HAD superfamily hydrolase